VVAVVVVDTHLLFQQGIFLLPKALLGLFLLWQDKVLQNWIVELKSSLAAGMVATLLLVVAVLSILLLWLPTTIKQLLLQTSMEL
jgi:hypothetical protein